MKFRINYFLQITLFTIIVLFSSSVESFSQSSNQNLSKLTHESEIILIGKVVKSQSKWNEKKDRIITNVTIKADEYIKGDNSKEMLIVTVPGGEVGDVGEIYTHMPVFESEEEILLFANTDRRNNLVVSMGASGKHNITKGRISSLSKNNSSGKVEDIKDQIVSLIKNQK